MSAMPIGMPGWPELAACTASMARKRMALASSRRLGVGMADPEMGGGPAHAARCRAGANCRRFRACGQTGGRLRAAKTGPEELRPRIPSLLRNSYTRLLTCVALYRQGWTFRHCEAVTSISGD